MPAKIAKLPSGDYQVRTPNAVHAKGTTLKKAKSQQRLLNAIDHNPEFAAMIKSRRKVGKGDIARPRS